MILLNIYTCNLCRFEILGSDISPLMHEVGVESLGSLNEMNRALGHLCAHIG